MLALCSMLWHTFYTQNNAGMIGPGLVGSTGLYQCTHFDTSVLREELNLKKLYAVSRRVRCVTGCMETFKLFII